MHRRCSSRYAGVAASLALGGLTHERGEDLLRVKDGLPSNAPGKPLGARLATRLPPSVDLDFARQATADYYGDQHNNQLGAAASPDGDLAVLQPDFVRQGAQA